MRDQDRPHIVKSGAEWSVCHNRHERRQIGPAHPTFEAAVTFARYLSRLRAERAGTLTDLDRPAR